MATRLLIAQLSDPHIGWEEAGSDSVAGLRRAVAAVLALDPSPDLVVVTGDVAHEATDAQYATAAEILGEPPMPLLVVPGNHDDREKLRATFPLRTAELDGLRVIGLDTLVPGRDDGELADGELERLTEELEAHPHTPTVLVMHHPPLLTGHPGVDEFALVQEDRSALRTLLLGQPQIAAVIAGHLHSPLTGTIGRTPVVVCPSTNLQLGFTPGADDELTLHVGPTHFALHTLTPDRRLLSQIRIAD